MNTRSTLASATFALLLFAGLAPNAAATSQRTFVASTGSDANACTVAAPCRSFTAAIAQTNAGGEVIVLDSAGYGPVAISKAVAIAAPPGVYAGVSVLAGTGITVNAGPGNAVTLRGLTINAQGGTAGIAFTSGDALYVDGVIVSGFSGPGGVGLSAATGAATSSLFVKNSILRDNTTGLSTVTTGGKLNLRVERSLLERNAVGADVRGTVIGTIRGTTFSGGTIGLSAGLAGSGKSVELDLRNITITRNTGAGLAATAASSPTSLTVISSSVSQNGTGIQAAGGGNNAYLSDSTILRNTTGISATGGGAIFSRGDNRLFNNTVNGTFTVNQAPVVNAGADQTITLPASAALAGTVSDDGLPNPPGAVSIAWTKVSGPGTVTFGNATAAVTSAAFGVDGTYVLRLTASDGALSMSDDVQITVNPGDGLPPDPATVASALDRSVASNPGVNTKFLYTGLNPIQTGVLPGTIDPRRAAVLRGRVLDRAGTPLPRATIRIVGHPEFGQTLSRLDGGFDLAVNGGGPLTIDYRATGFVPAQRQLYVPWQDYVVAPDVSLVTFDTAVTVVTAGAGAMQVHRANAASDADGTRTATLLFPAGTTAQMVMSDGSTQPLASLAVRATEFTVGPGGPRAMPAELPPTSAYTYAAELSVDEAVAASAKSVTFSQPLSYHVENFLHFPVGMAVPAGFYDRASAVWVPMDNGRVIKIIGVSAGLAVVDSVGGGTLPPLTFDNAELAQLASLYPVGQELWRVPVSHFSPIDFNWPFIAPGDAVKPDVPQPDSDPTVDQCVDDAPVASVVECQNQVLGQSLPVVGTPFTLNYRSLRAPGRTARYKMPLKLSGATVPGSLKRIELTLSVAGRKFAQTFPAAPNQTTTFAWDGLDAYGRRPQGAQPITGSIAYVYDAVYATPSGIVQSFARFGFAGLSATRGEMRLVEPVRTSIGAMDARPLGLGGWILGPHHVYDPAGQALHLGDGSRRRPEALVATIRKVDTGAFSGNGHIATAPDGTIFLAASIGPGPLNIVARITPNGQVTQFPAASFPGLTGGISAMTVGPDGRLYLTESSGSFFSSHRVWALAPDGTTAVIAGTGFRGFSGDDGPATAAQLNNPGGLAFGPDGSLYVSDSENFRIRRIDPTGIISTTAGTGVNGFSGDGGLAGNAQMYPGVIAVGPDGTLYLQQNNGRRIRRITADGLIMTVAGTGAACTLATLPCGDGGPALQATLNVVTAMQATADGSLYLDQLRSNNAEAALYRVIGPDGIIRRVAGNGALSGTPVDGMPAAQAPVSGWGLAVAPDGTVYVTGGKNGALVRIAPPLPGFTASELLVASEDGRLLYDFDTEGRHLRTLSTLTGAVLTQFNYDAGGRLATIVEKTGGIDNVTTVEHDANGNPKAIVGPYGQRTTLATDANGFLADSTNPASETTHIVYTIDGLMRSFTDPRGKTANYFYDADGRLTGAQDPTGALQTFARAEIPDGYTVTKTTALGHATVHKVERLANGDQKLTTTFPAGEVTETLNRADGTVVAKSSDGTVVSVTLGPDPRFGMQAPVATSVVATSPGGLTRTALTSVTATLSDPKNPLSLDSLIETVTVNGRVTTNEYAAATRTLMTTTPAGRTSIATFDPLDRLLTRQAGDLEAIRFAYDARGRIATIARGTGAATRTFTFGYDALGYNASLTDPTGAIAQFTRDAAWRLTRKTFPDGSTIDYALDPAGNVASVTPPGRPAHMFTHSARNEVTQYAPPSVPGTGPVDYVHDADRRFTSVTRPDARSIAVDFDANGRPVSRTFRLNAVTTDSDALGYDAAGRLSTLASLNGSATAYAYDGALATGVTWSGPVAGTATRTIDSSFRTASEAVNGGNVVARSYDADDLAVGFGNFTLTRNSLNGLPVSSSLGTIAASIGYNGFGEVTSYSVRNGATPLLAYAFTRDAIGRIARKIETVAGLTDTYDYAYDTAGQLAGVKKNGTAIESYGYDANGNRISATVGGATTAATFDDQDRIVQSGVTAYVHNAAGDRVTRTIGISPATTYDYDAAGRLLGVKPSGGLAITYVVDATGRRIGKKIDGVLVRQFLYARDRIVAELDGVGALISRFVYAGRGAPVYFSRGGVDFRIVTDNVGSVRLVVNASTGAIVQRIDYDGFGKVVADSNPGFQPFGFAGGLYDPDSGLVRFGARDYDADVGRWTTRDPIGFGGLDGNLYRYAHNDPVNVRDPSGEADEPTLAELMDYLREVIRKTEDALNAGINTDGRLAERRAMRAWAKQELAALRKLDQAASGGGFGKVNCGGLLAQAGIALQILDVILEFKKAWENDRTIWEQDDVEMAEKKERGIDQTISCVGLVCLVIDTDGGMM